MHFWKHHLLGLYAIILVSQFGSAISYDRKDIQGLIEQLKESYDKTLLPRSQGNVPVVVTVMVHLEQITLDISSQVAFTDGWFTFLWRDDFLTWDPKDVNGVDHIMLPTEEIWHPDVTVENSYEGSNEPIIDQHGLKLIVDSQGDIYTQPKILTDTSCTADISVFPYDIQVCSISVTTLASTDKSVILKKNGSLEFVTENPSGRFEIVEVHALDTTHTSEFMPGKTFTGCKFILVLQRKSLYYTLNIIVPVTLMSFLNCIVFLLPPECGERQQMSMTVLLAITVFLGIIDSVLPETSDGISVLKVYVTLLFALSAGSVVLSAVALNVHYKNPKLPVPSFVKAICRLKRSAKGGLAQPKGSWSTDLHDASGSLQLKRFQLAHAYGNGKVPAEPLLKRKYWKQPHGNTYKRKSDIDHSHEEEKKWEVADLKLKTIIRKDEDTDGDLENVSAQTDEERTKTQNNTDEENRDTETKKNPTTDKWFAFLIRDANHSSCQNKNGSAVSGPLKIRHQTGDAKSSCQDYSSEFDERSSAVKVIRCNRRNLKRESCPGAQSKQQMSSSKEGNCNSNNSALGKRKRLHFKPFFIRSTARKCQKNLSNNKDKNHHATDDLPAVDSRHSSSTARTKSISKHSVTDAHSSASHMRKSEQEMRAHDSYSSQLPHSSVTFQQSLENHTNRNPPRAKKGPISQVKKFFSCRKVVEESDDITWHEVGNVLDQVFFWIFFTFTLGLTIAVIIIFGIHSDQMAVSVL